jgi:hypothetical protein
MGLVPPDPNDEARRDGLLAGLRQTGRVIHGPGGPARIVAIYSNALATG